uniref:Si:dkey-174i8.1 n=1 Tax=Haplochromis burtoni TaxID=8153 RepID=A0A3Q2VHG6_HAPBU
QRLRQSLLLALEVEKPRLPHFIFIMVDDQGYGDIGYIGSDIHTPVLDRLAAEGVKLENYYVQPICSPSRSQLMTGRIIIHLQLLFAAEVINHIINRLFLDTPHTVGKWHLGFCRPSCLPTGRGFQSFLGTLTGSGDHFSYQSCDGAEACGFDLNPTEIQSLNSFKSSICTTRVKQFLKRHDPHTPLFLYLSLQATHAPLQVPDHFLHLYDSQLVQELKTQELYENSVLIYSSDNGGQPLSGGSNWTLRSGKGTYWEGGIWTVGFVHSPLLKKKGIVSRALIHVSDWYPTLLGLAGARQSHHGLDGHDVWGSISEGLPCPRTEILFNIDPVSRKAGEPYDKALILNGFGIWDTVVRAAL